MSDLKISQLNNLPGASLASGDELAIVDASASETKKITSADLVRYGYGLLSAGVLDGDVIEAGTIAARGTLQLTDSTSSTSITTAATPNSVKSAYDLADAALPKSGGTMTGAILGDNSIDPTQPGYGFDGDADTGMVRLGANELALVTGGTARITMDASGNVTVPGNFTVQGTTTVIDSTVVEVEDANITIGKVASPTDVTADGGGITLKGSTDKTISWVDSTDAWTFSEHVDLAAAKEYRIAGVKVLDATSLGSAVVSSSLTSLGTIGSGTWQGTTVATGYGGTGQTSYTDGQLLIGKTDGTLAKATLTAGSNITITNGDGTISIAASGNAGTVTSVDVSGGTGLTSSGGPITSSGTITVDLDNTAVTPGSYTYASITVDQQGRLTAASSGTTPLTSSDIGTSVQAYDADTAKTDAVQSFTAAQRGSVVTLTPGATVTPDFAAGNNFSLALDQNTTIANPTNLTAGQSGSITITQDSTARTVSYGNYFYFEGGIPTFGTTTGAVSTLVYYVNSSTRVTAALISEPTNT